MASLPLNVRESLISCYLAGESLVDSGRVEVIEFIRRHSNIVPELSEYPGTYTMLEKMYGFEDVHYPMDHFFKTSPPAFISLESRFKTVNANAVKHITQILLHQDTCTVLDLGSGPGRNGIQISIDYPEIARKTKFICVDSDSAAIIHGMQLVRQYGLKNIEFVEKSMARLHKMFRGTADYGLLIGVLCSLSFEERVGLLKIIKPYFKKGSRVVGAGLLDKMLELDLFCSYILRETAGWVLQHLTIGSIKAAFEAAGYSYEGYFQEEPTRCYEIGIGLA